MKIEDKKRVSISAWARGFSWSMKVGYKKLRDNRIVAMAYEKGWCDAIRAQKRAEKSKKEAA